MLVVYSKSYLFAQKHQHRKTFDVIIVIEYTK